VEVGSLFPGESLSRRTGSCETGRRSPEPAI